MSSHPMKAIAVAGAIVLLAATACSYRDRPGAAAPTTYAVSLTDLKVTAPASVPSGEALSLDVTNDGAVEHTLAVDVDGEQVVTRLLQGGESQTLSVPALDAGDYTFYCTVPGHKEAGMQTTVTAGGTSHGTGSGSMTYHEMDDAHEAGVKAFPAKTERLGGRILEPARDGNVKVFELTAEAIDWEVSPDKTVTAYAYNGQVPGPEIHVSRGDRVRFVLHNELPESTSIHFHGLTVPNTMDGVPFITQPVVEPGEDFTYEFTIKDRPGTHMYHSHHNATVQVGRGLLGALIVDGAGSRYDVDQVMVVGDGELGYTLNGKGFPATAPIVARKGDLIRIRFMNEGQIIHPMHLHGFHFTAIARDGYPIEPFKVDTLSVAPGERWDVEFRATLKGVWALHCHILSHAESEHGMHGMVTAVIVQ